MTELQDGISSDINHAMMGTRRVALVDSWDEQSRRYLGRLQRDAPEIDGQVVIEPTLGPHGAAPTEMVGRFAEVEVTGAHPYELTARFAGRHW